MACAIEDAGFEIRDQIGWAYGSGFPKSHDVSKAIDKAFGAERPVIGQKQAGMGTGKTFGMLQAEGNNSSASHTIDVTAPATAAAAAAAGWGTALKPAWEPIVLARKPMRGTVAENWLEHGTGAINVGACRIGDEPRVNQPMGAPQNSYGGYGATATATATAGRWPSNVVHDGSQETIAAFPAEDDETAARFFYSAKADSIDRAGSKHPTVKPVDLMQWLVRLVTPKGGLVLDPFAGTGTTAEACFREGMSCIAVERESEYQADIRRRMALVMAGPDERSRESIKARTAGHPIDAGPLFNDAPPRRENIRDTKANSTSARPNNRTDWTEEVNGSAT